MKKILFISLVASLTIGCSNETETTPKEAESKPAKIFKTQTDALEKAKQVEGLLLEKAAQQQEILDK